MAFVVSPRPRAMAACGSAFPSTGLAPPTRLRPRSRRIRAMEWAQIWVELWWPGAEVGPISSTIAFPLTSFSTPVHGSSGLPRCHTKSQQQVRRRPRIFDARRFSGSKLLPAHRETRCVLLVSSHGARQGPRAKVRFIDSELSVRFFNKFFHSVSLAGKNLVI